MNQERWAEIKGYEGMYLISDHGRVLSLERERSNGVSSYIQKERVLKQSLTTTGYKKVELSKNNTKKTFKVHRLVGEAFVENRYSKPVINHKDGDQLNNYYKNLEWCTQKENVQHAIDIGLRKTLNINKKELEVAFNNKTTKEVADDFGVSKTTILRYLKKNNLGKELTTKYKISDTKLKEMLSNGLSNKEISKEIGCDPSLISHYKKRLETKGKIYG